MLSSTHRPMHCPSVRTFSSAARVDATASELARASEAVKAAVAAEAEADQNPPRRRMSEVKISEVLKAKHTIRWVEMVICNEATLGEAVVTCIERKLSGMMVVDREEAVEESSRERGKVVGLLTSRDILRILASSIKDGDDEGKVLNRRVGDFMTPLNKVVYARPDETVGMCRSIMAKLGIKCLPVLADGRVEGILTSKDLSDFYLDAKDLGGKKNYLADVSQRVGLGSDTSMAEPPQFVRSRLATSHAPLYLNVGVGEYPHPYKSAEGVGSNRRDFGPRDFAVDAELSEDAHFVKEIELNDESNTKIQKLLYMGVADGVGSWREYGVDPRDFSHTLMEGCEQILEEASLKCLIRHGDRDEDRKEVCRMVSPAELLNLAYERAKEKNVIGSSTACIALFDSVRHQLHFSNLGDSGIIVLRHIDSDVAGALKRDRDTPRNERTSDLRVAFVSQQQLRSFNHPFQLGWTGKEIVDESSSFKDASDSCTSSIHILRGDIILMASDGLFDNVDIDDITAIALQWERDHAFIDKGGIAARERRWANGESYSEESARNVDELADLLCQKARENSLDNSIDSPFALLAKDNDIMWSGGMPDDCSVIAMHVVGRQVS